MKQQDLFPVSFYKTFETAAGENGMCRDFQHKIRKSLGFFFFLEFYEKRFLQLFTFSSFPLDLHVIPTFASRDFTDQTSVQSISPVTPARSEALHLISPPQGSSGKQKSHIYLCNWPQRLSG